jgi:hypothetical protein
MYRNSDIFHGNTENTLSVNTIFFLSLSSPPYVQFLAPPLLDAPAYSSTENVASTLSFILFAHRFIDPRLHLCSYYRGICSCHIRNYIWL